MAALIEAQRADLPQVDRAALQAAFAAFGYRPQFFMAALAAVLSPLAGISGLGPLAGISGLGPLVAANPRFEAALLQAAHQQKLQDEAQMASDYWGLRTVEQLVLWRMLEQGPRFRPYDADALRFYRIQLGQPVSVQQAQKALEALRKRTPAMVWKSAHGEYAVEDAAMHRWAQTRLAAGDWPPQPPQ